MNHLEEMVKEYHRHFNLDIRTRPTLPDEERRFHYTGMLFDYHEELQKQEMRDSLEGVALCLGKLLYVAMGYLVEAGVPVGPLLEEVHRSNMSKLGADGKPILSQTGLILNGTAYTPPDIAHVLRQAGGL